MITTRSLVIAISTAVAAVVAAAGPASAQPPGAAANSVKQCPGDTKHTVCLEIWSEFGTVKVRPSGGGWDYFDLSWTDAAGDTKRGTTARAAITLGRSSSYQVTAVGHKDNWPFHDNSSDSITVTWPR